MVMTEHITELLDACEMLMREADNGSWHLSRDCWIEDRHDCGLCVAIERARAAIADARRKRADDD